MQLQALINNKLSNQIKLIENEEKSKIILKNSLEKGFFNKTNSNSSKQLEKNK